MYFTTHVKLIYLCCYPLVFEFGTMDNHTALGGVESLYRMVSENQGFHHGYASESDKEKIQNKFREAFYPSDSKWRAIRHTV